MRKLFNDDNGEEHNFWMSYTDLMSAFLVVFIIISVVMYNFYAESKAKYDHLFDTFSGMNPEQIESKFTAMSHELDSLKGADLKNLIFEYKDVFLSNEFIKVNFDSDRGSIVIECKNANRFLFASGKSDFEPELKTYLDGVRKPLVVKTMSLWSKHNYKNVELRIEGHTDPNGLHTSSQRGSNDSFLENLKLSSDRANNVYNYILRNDDLTDDEKEFVKKNMISVGYSFSTRVNMNNINDSSKDPSSRRIEFRIISK